MNRTTPTVLIVPGLRDHVADHWQTLLAAKLPKVRSVPPLEQDKLSCAARVDAIDRALRDIEGPVVIVAHSAGAMMVVHWAARLGTPSTPGTPDTLDTLGARNALAIRGALLAAPADLETPMPAGYPTLDVLDSNGWLPVPRSALPFPSIVAASSNDPLARLDRTRELARCWGSRLVELGAVGHLNPNSGFGEWPGADELIHALS
ncbi:alpha/beta hydrolase [Variovorax sp. H27-G14]|uniref:RBBP9/YdeN family alpha/beta hydrolase n=1 Tax=Variovorax sp. H27-G14 TaxID=3111914 RepID=UPI0038FD10C4